MNKKESITEKIQKIWLGKIQKNEQLTVADLFPFSKIRLKKKRNKKKFNKYYRRYISENVREAYWGCLIATPLVGSFKKQFENLDLLNIEPLEDTPKGDLYYVDYKFPDENKEKINKKGE
jgi:hypothetical protein